MSPGPAPQQESAAGDRRADLVLSAGGVKGIALAGAVQALGEAGYDFPRVAGTSAGAMAGVVTAALRRRGEPMSRLVDIAGSADYTRFTDRGVPGRYLGPLGFLADGFALVLEQGIYEGDHLERWLEGVLADLGVRTFGDLRLDDAGGDGETHHDYGLMVTASDLSRKRLVQLPWDYGDYGLDPDEQSVARAVRASASIPFFYEPVRLDTPHGEVTLVDGGLVAAYPINAFDRYDQVPPRWPTIGVRLSTRAEDRHHIEPVGGVVAEAVALLQTSLEAAQAEHYLDPCNIARTVYVDTQGVGGTDFDLTEAQEHQLVAAGRSAAEKFLSHWDFGTWLADCR